MNYIIALIIAAVFSFLFSGCTGGRSEITGEAAPTAEVCRFERSKPVGGERKRAPAERIYKIS